MVKRDGWAVTGNGGLAKRDGQTQGRAMARPWVSFAVVENTWATPGRERATGVVSACVQAIGLFE